MKKIGAYLIENKICDESALNNALGEQLKLKEKGAYKPIGTILMESAGIAPEELHKALSRMQFDILAASTLFQNISSDVITEILSLAESKVFPEGTIIFNKGDQPEAYFIVVSGRLKVFLPQDAGSETILATLKAGDGFGETSLFNDKPYTTSIETITPANLLILSKTDFNHLCTQNSEFSMAFIKGYANRLMQKEAEIVKAGEKELAYQQFVSQQDELALPELIGQTRIINRLREKINTVAQNNLPVLIYGEPGTEGLVVAGDIHKNSPYSAYPFLSMDAENIALEGYGAILEADSGAFQMEMAQSSFLFGYEDMTFSFPKAKGLGLLQICHDGSVVIRNIDKLAKGVQNKLLSYLQSGTFMTVGGHKPIISKARIIATTSKDLNLLAADSKFNPGLLALLQANNMTVPPLRKRKSDLRLLVDFIIIMECFKTPDRKLIKGVSPEAHQRIMEYDWPGNMDELQIVVRRAINLALGEYLIPADIFIGMAPPKGKYTINLLQFEKVRKIFNSRAYPVVLQAATVLFFGLIIVLSFKGNQLPDKNVSLLLIWGLWEPLLIMSWFVGARIWCAVCPMGAVNDLLNRIGKVKFKVPAIIHDYGFYFSAAGLAIIIWAQVASGMYYSPMTTGYLLLAIVSFAILSGILFKRRVWCRYLCPLGMLGAIFSGCSVVEWRSNNSICNSTCKDNSCYKGDGKTHGCPLYQGPFSLHSNQNCILCGNCVKTCPNDSPVFNLRIPGHELWAALKPEKVTTIFVPVILATQIFRGFLYTPFMQDLSSGVQFKWSLYSVIMFAAIVVSFIYCHIAGAIAFGSLKKSAIKKGDLFIHAILPLAFAYEFVYQLNPLLTRLGHFLPTLGRQIGIDLESWDFAYHPDSIKPWQVFFLLLGMAASIAFLKALIKKHQDDKGKFAYKKIRNIPILILGCVYIWMFIVR